MRFFKRCLCFAIILVLAVSLAGFCLRPISGFALKMQEFSQDEYTGVILGHSWARDGLNPLLLAEDGEKIFNISTGGINFSNMEYVLKEMRKTSDIKTVYLDLCLYYWDEKIGSALINSRPNISGSLSGINQAEYWCKNQGNKDFTAAVFNFEFSVDALKSIKEVVSDKLSMSSSAPGTLLQTYASDKVGDYLGSGFQYVTQRNEELKPAEAITFQREDISTHVEENFRELIAYCRKHDIAVVAFSSALPPARLKSENWDDVHAYYSELCREVDIPYYDMNWVHWELLPRTAEDYSDLDGHMMGATAERQTLLLKSILHSEEPQSFFVQSYDEVLSELEP